MELHLVWNRRNQSPELELELDSDKLWTHENLI